VKTSFCIASVSVLALALQLVTLRAVKARTALTRSLWAGLAACAAAVGVAWAASLPAVAGATTIAVGLLMIAAGVSLVLGRGAGVK
jgi:hypothetical protein